jgi:hypothetical protein
MAVTITRTANPSGVSASSNVASYSSVAIGTAAPNRIVVVNVTSELSAASINSCTIGGTSMNAGTQGNQGIVYSRQFYLLYPTGTTATIAVTYGANPTNNQNHISVYTVTDGAYSSNGADQSTDMDSTDPLTTGSTTIGTGGGMIAVAGCATDTVAKTWSNLTEDLDADVGSHRHTTATSTSAGTATRTCTGGTDGEDGALSWIIFTDNTEPTVSLGTPADSGTVSDTTPDLTFTGTDTNSDAIRYNPQIDTATFPTILPVALEDNFNDNSINTLLWTSGSYSGTVAESGSRLTLTPTNNTVGDGCELTSVNTYNFTGSSVFVKIVQVTSGSVNTSLRVMATAGTSEVLMYTESGTLYLAKIVSSSQTNLASVAYNSSTMLWWRIRESGGTTYWDTSADGKSWTNRHSVANPITMTAAKVSLSVYEWEAVNPAGSAIFDNLNIYPSLIDAVSGTDAGFSGSPDNTDPFTSGQAVTYTPQSPLSNTTTYYWRVRGIDPSGSNAYGAWSSTRSFYVDTGGAPATAVKDLIGGFGIIPFAR